MKNFKKLLSMVIIAALVTTNNMNLQFVFGEKIDTEYNQYEDGFENEIEEDNQKTDKEQDSKEEEGKEENYKDEDKDAEETIEEQGGENTDEPDTMENEEETLNYGNAVYEQYNLPEMIYNWEDIYTISNTGVYDISVLDTNANASIDIEDNLSVTLKGSSNKIFEEITITVGENSALTIEDFNVENHDLDGIVHLKNNAVLLADGENNLIYYRQEAYSGGIGTINVLAGAEGTVSSESGGILNVTGDPAVYANSTQDTETVLNIEGNINLFAYGLGDYPAVGASIFKSTVNISGNARVYAENNGSGTGIGTKYNFGWTDMAINIRGNAFAEARGGDYGAAGIGTGLARSYNLNNEIYINIVDNASVLAYGGNSEPTISMAGAGPGIGGGAYAGVSEIYINTTGKVEAYGGRGRDSNTGAPGIGVGKGGNFFDNEGYIEKIHIVNGEIFAYGYDGGAGIGTGIYAVLPDIIIEGGNITAYGGSYAAGIGSGILAGREPRGGIYINNAAIEAYGGTGGAGIGTGYKSSYGFDIEIGNSTIFAQGAREGAGIGGGYYSAGGNIVLTSASELEVYGGNASGVSAIGGGQHGGKAELYIENSVILGAFSSGKTTENISERPAIYANFKEEQDSAYLVMASLGEDHILNEDEIITVDGRTYRIAEENTAMAFTVSGDGDYIVYNSEGEGILLTSAMAPVEKKGCLWSEDFLGQAPNEEYDDSWKEKYNQSTYSMEGNTITVHGAYYDAESLYYYVIPSIAGEEHQIILDFTAYFEQISDIVYNRLGGWSPGANRSVKIKIINDSPNYVIYENAVFDLIDDYDYLPHLDEDMIKYQMGFVPESRNYEKDIQLDTSIPGTDRNKIPYTKAVLRTISTPLQYLFSAQAGNELLPGFQLGYINHNAEIDLMLQADDEIESRLNEVYGNRFKSYTEYILHFYNNVTETGNNAASLEELPIDCKVNLFGYAGTEQYYKTGNAYVRFPAAGNEAARQKYLDYVTENSDFFDEYSYTSENSIGDILMYTIEPDKEIQSMAWNLMYSNGILFTFLNDDANYSVVFGNTKNDQSNFGWKTYTDTDFSIENLMNLGENSTPAQKSIMQAFGAMELVQNQALTLENPSFGLQGYYAANAVLGTAYFRGLTANIELKVINSGVEAEKYAVHYHSNYLGSNENPSVFEYGANTDVIVQNGSSLFIGPEGFTFDKWEYRNDGLGTVKYYTSGQRFIMPEEDVHLYALWKYTDTPEPPEKPEPERPEKPDPPKSEKPDVEKPEVVPVFSYQKPEPELNREDHFAYIAGYPDGTVKPEGYLTREEAATIFFRLLNDDTRDYYYSDENPFSDVNNERWSNKAISTLYQASIVTGYEDNSFRPDEKVTRAELAMIISIFDTKTADVISGYFTDTQGHWAENAIDRVYSIGWISGYPDKSFKPGNYITRAETVVMVNRALERYVESVDDFIPEMIIWPDNMDVDTWYYYDIQEATNSHEYERKQESLFEKWIGLRENPDWYLLER